MDRTKCHVARSRWLLLSTALLASASGCVGEIGEVADPDALSESPYDDEGDDDGVSDAGPRRDGAVRDAGPGAADAGVDGAPGVGDDAMKPGPADSSADGSVAQRPDSSRGDDPPPEDDFVEGSVRWVGRVDSSNPNEAKFSWQGAGVVATVRGAAIAVKLRTDGTDTVFFQPVIDGEPGERFEVRSGGDRVVTLASGLSDDDHDVELYRDTEGTYGTSTFLGFTSGELRGARTGSGRVIEVVGDSISAGFGALGYELHPNGQANPSCSWSAANSPWYQTYAAIAGHELGAEVSTVARSGWGIYRDGAGNTSGNMPSIYENMFGSSTEAKWNFERKASVVVINLGTNDWYRGDPGGAFETSYIQFLERVRSRYPDAWIFLTIGSMLAQDKLSQVNARLRSVLAARTSAGDQKVFTFDLGSQDLGSNGSTPTGCSWHPSAADHERMARILKQQLSAKLGW